MGAGSCSLRATTRRLEPTSNPTGNRRSLDGRRAGGVQEARRPSGGAALRHRAKAGGRPSGGKFGVEAAAEEAEARGVRRLFNGNREALVERTPRRAEPRLVGRGRGRDVCGLEGGCGG